MLKPALIAVVLSLPGAALASPADGLWLSPVKQGEIQIFDCGADLCGRIENGDDIRANPDLKDVKNKDAALRTRRLKGAVIMTGFQGGPSEWKDGEIYDPQSGNTYHASLTLVNANTVHLRGCLVAPLCRTQTWTRVK